MSCPWARQFIICLVLTENKPYSAEEYKGSVVMCYTWNRRFTSSSRDMLMIKTIYPVITTGPRKTSRYD